MNIGQVETQTIDSLVNALLSMERGGLYEYTAGDKELLTEASRLINDREFLTVAQHTAIVHMAVRYL